jgi:hypothetical protein
MSFFNEQGLCQASVNPLHKIIDTSNNNSHLNNFRTSQNVGSSKQQNIHHFQNVDSLVQNEYNNYSNQVDQDFESVNNILPKSIDISHNFQYPQNQISNQKIMQQNWSQDFNRLSVQDNNEQLHEQFHEQPIHTLNPIVNMNSMNQQHLLLSNIPLANIRNNNLELYRNQQQQQQQFVNESPTEIHSSANLNNLSNEFENAFSEIETELKMETQSENQKAEEEEIVTTNDEEDKIKFAILAQNVFNIMNNTPKHVSSTTSNKFKASGFMQLMNKISNREIEVSNDKKKLVNQYGMDIRSELSDPLAGLSMNETLDSSFNSAVKVSQTKPIDVNANTWQSDFA